MCEKCDLIPLCSKVMATRFGASRVAICKVGTERGGRVAICVRERGIEKQRLIIAHAGILALVQALVCAVRRM